MKTTIHAARRGWWPALLLSTLFTGVALDADVGAGADSTETLTRERLIAVAREIMQAAGYCALITVDESGQPQARAMDPFPPEDDMVVWLATNPQSRKVRQIRNDPRVTLYYFDAERPGYVTIVGVARLVEDAEEKARRWKAGWEAFYPDRKESYLLIAVTPRKLEVVSDADGLVGDSSTWTPLSVEFGTE